jgi:hypothetical protein
VRRREVVFAPEARDDLWRLYERIATAADSSVALAYIERIKAGRARSATLGTKKIGETAVSMASMVCM